MCKMSIKALLVLFTDVVRGEIYLSKSISFSLELLDINTNPGNSCFQPS